MPLLVETSEADILGAILYLLSIAFPVISLVASWVTLKGLLVTRHLRQEKRTSKLRSFKLQPLQAAEGKLEQTSAHFNTSKFSEWSTVLRDRMLLRKLNSLKTSNAGFPGDISLRDNQERMTPGESDRMFNLSVPQPRLSMPSPVANVRKTITRDSEDNEDTPRPSRFLKQSIQPVPLNTTTEVNHNRLSAYSMLREQGGRASSPGDYPSSPNRTDVTISRPDSLASSPGTKSIKLASVQQAVRGRMSLGPTFLIGGSQGETMFTAGRSLDLEAAIRTEIGDLNRKQGESEWAHTGEAFGSSRSTPRLSHDPSNLQSANRRSTDILGEYNKQKIKQERRRTFDFGRVWSGWKRLHEKSLEDSALAFVDVNPERLEAIMMSE
ncbi:hypothetical protein QFC19_003585 [Naganishia cerealis]|uniref:Uncharacterized protein n=1 Tax=Naganishia cerealis TaxID=610337 RepID=A0ACC2W0K0_9TREE|nr:hypothetical protein QFC19_003585 [Naganishia cerealis]